jgi:hypothetical protein
MAQGEKYCGALKHPVAWTQHPCSYTGQICHHDDFLGIEALSVEQNPIIGANTSFPVLLWRQLMLLELVHHALWKIIEPYNLPYRRTCPAGRKRLAERRV